MEKLDTGHFGYKAFIALSFNFPDLFIYLPILNTYLKFSLKSSTKENNLTCFTNLFCQS